MFSSAMLESYKSVCQLLRQSSTPDGLGGQRGQWEIIATFDGLFGFRSSTQAMIAEKGGFTSLYSVYVPRDTDIQFHDVIRRMTDGATFRVTHPGKDVRTPDISFIDWRKIDAERWEIP